MSYVYLQMSIGWNWLDMPVIVYVHIHLGMGYFKARGVKKDSIPDMIEIELTNIPVKEWDCHGIHIHFMGRSTLRQLLVRPKDQDP